DQTALRGLTEAVIFEPATGQILASSGLLPGISMQTPPAWALDIARAGDVALLAGDDADRVRAIVQLDSTPVLMLEISRPVDARILDYMRRTEQAVAEYARLDEN